MQHLTRTTGKSGVQMPRTDQTGGLPLTDEQVSRYWADGYCHGLRAVSAETAGQWRAELEGIERDWLDRDLPLPLNTYKRVNAHAVMPLAANIARHPALLDIVESILGPDIMIWSAEFFIKEPRTRQVVSMHQDLTYWGLGAIDNLTTAWIALSPATRASGCMDFVRGSHKNEILPHADTYLQNNLLSRGQEIQVDVNDVDKTAIELLPGEISLHHGLMIHGSGPNSSDDRRIGVAIRYLSPAAKQEVADRDYAMLARGADRHGHFVNIAPPTTLFSPNSLALYDEIRAAQAKALAAGASGDVALYAASGG